jgi:tripartite-type tricarboxylate transporter receptor subunit TctC
MERHPPSNRIFEFMNKPAFLIAVLLLMSGPSNSIAEETSTWSPFQPVRIMVPFQAGGPIDTIARTIAQQLNEKWGQTFIVENRTGAGGNIGMELVAKAPADGYTLGTASGGTHGANATLYGSRLPFDPVKDFTPITMLAEMKNILVVHRSLRITNLQELIAYAKTAPGQLTFGSSGTGTIQHLTGEMFKAAAKINIVHVSYRGQAQALPDLLSGRISMMFLGVGDAAEHIRSGSIVPIGIASAERSSLLPNVVPLAEQGLAGFNAVTWFGLVAPSGVPRNIADAYYRQISASLSEPELRGRLLRMGLDPITMPSMEFGRFISGEVEKWGSVIKSVGVHID